MRIGTFFGIRVVVNGFFLIVLFLLGFIGRLPEALVLFGVVILHEIGHIVVARGYNLQVTELELLPFGGVARIEDLVELDPFVESSVAIAGPLTNLLLLGAGMVLRTYEVLPVSWLDFFLITNLVIGGFNLVPALPLDGGRIYRARLTRRVGFRRATERAVRLGKAFALIFAMLGGVGLYLGYANLSLLVLAFFVFFAAHKEEQHAMYVFMRYLARKKEELSARECLFAEHLVAQGETPVKQVLRNFVPRKYHLVLVLDDQGGVTGIATEWDVIDGMFEQGIDTPIRDVISWKV